MSTDIAPEEIRIFRHRKVGEPPSRFSLIFSRTVGQIVIGVNSRQKQQEN
jgi:hypothetical protein